MKKDLQEVIIGKNTFKGIMKGNNVSLKGVEITKEIVDANPHILLSIGYAEFDKKGKDCPAEGQTQPPGPGTWIKVNGTCVWIPA